MSKRIGNVILIEVTPDAKCEVCGCVAELRPYGPCGENICFECGQRDIDTTMKKCAAVLFGLPDETTHVTKRE